MVLLLFSIRVAECPPVWVRAIHSVFCAAIVNVNQFMCASFPFGFEDDCNSS